MAYSSFYDVFGKIKDKVRHEFYEVSQ